MQLVHVCLRNDRHGSLAAAGLILALVAFAAVGYVVLVSNDYVKVEAAITDLDFGHDPMTAKVQVRITNLYNGALVVEKFAMTVWANKEQTVAFTSAEISGVVVPPGETSLFVLPVEIRNADAFTGKVWVDVDATWAHGAEHYSESVDGKEISVGSALASLS